MQLNVTLIIYSRYSIQITIINQLKRDNMYTLTNIQNGDVTKIENIFDVMTFLNGDNYDRLKSVNNPELVYNMMTNYDRHTR